jgi:predicted ferric reductase
VALVVTILPTFLGARRHFYEVFSSLHLATAGLAAAALWYHLTIQKSPVRFYILGGICFWMVWHLIGFVADAFYNISWGHNRWLPLVNIATVYRTKAEAQVVMVDACHIEITLHRIWKIQPGQYVFVTIWRLGFPSVFQRHPFWIVWWEQDQKNGTMKLDILVRRRNGFTRRLLSHRDNDYSAWISRPLGRSKNFGDYGSILMFATDFGIAAHLPYLKMLTQGRSEASIRTRRVVIIWQVQDCSKLGSERVSGPVDKLVRSR